ncbi:hypothetical protein D9M72_624370 [compost metagenome]
MGDGAIRVRTVVIEGLELGIKQSVDINRPDRPVSSNAPDSGAYTAFSSLAPALMALEYRPIAAIHDHPAG